MAFTQLRSLLERTMNRSGIRSAVVGAQAQDVFRSLVREFWGDDAVRESVVGGLRDNVLKVDVRVPALAQEIRNREALLVRRLNAALQQPHAVRSLRIRVRSTRP